MEIKLNPNSNTCGAEKFFDAIQKSKKLSPEGSRYVEIIKVETRVVDGELTDVCIASAIGLMPYFPNWGHKSITFTEDGHIIRSTQIEGGFMDGVPVTYGEKGWTKSDEQI